MYSDMNAMEEAQKEMTSVQELLTLLKHRSGSKDHREKANLAKAAAAMARSLSDTLEACYLANDVLADRQHLNRLN